MIAGLVLAAGASERMGRPKALLPIGGRPAIEVVAGCLAEAGCAPIVVVLGRHAEEIRAGADLAGLTAIDHAGWAAGRTSSIQAGLVALPKSTKAVVLALVDMPLVRRATIDALLAAWEQRRDGTTVVAPSHGDRAGHPIVLARSVFAPLMELRPDESPRSLLRAESRALVPVDDPGVLIDLDRPEDLRHLRDQ